MIVIPRNVNWTHLPLPVKLMVAFGLVSVLTLFQALAIWHNVNAIDGNLQRITNSLIPQNERVGLLTQTILRASLESRHAILMSAPERRRATLDEVQRLKAEADRLVSELGDGVSSDEGRRRYVAIQQTQDAFWVAALGLVPLIEQGKMDEALDRIETTVVPTRNAFLNAVGLKKEWQVELLRDEAAASLARSDATEMQVIVMSAITSTLGLVVTVLFWRHDKLRIASNLDPLTGLINRREFERLARIELARLERVPGSVSLMMIDIDFFKRVNDELGHPAGDAVLQQLASRLSAGLRAVDIVARMGGEEFVVLLTDTDRQGAEIVAEKLRASVGQMPFHLSAKHMTVTASFGVTSLSRGSLTSLDELYATADQALYSAKNGGRNRVEFQAVPHGSEFRTMIERPLGAGAQP